MISKLSAAKNYTLHLIKESAEIVITNRVLKCITKSIEPRDILPSEKSYGYDVCVPAPVYEEIFFRGVVLTTFTLGQYIWSKIRKHQMTDETLKAQRIFRVRVTAVLFGLSHLINGVSIQVLFACASGLGWGYVAEHYNSTVPSMILHFTHNFSVYCITLNVISPVTWLITVIFLETLNIYIIKNDGDIKRAVVTMKNHVEWICLKGARKSMGVINCILNTLIQIPCKFKLISPQSLYSQVN
jgi:hypothetical protein